ncbi:MAG: heat-inducible transcription repressor HrcA [Bacilli bacterium]|nr:heat-inducible transcription repressor HrcA [Bacilli bacterium]
MLSERKENVLKLIVEEYIKTIKPVGSKNICEVLNCSSATIRNEMQALEEEGYLEKTHTSSGRVPSEKGYRYYVDHLMKPKEMNGQEVLNLQKIFNNTQLELTDSISKSLQIISDMTNYTAVILDNKSSENKLKQVEVIPINDENVIAIVVTDTGHVENKTINIKGSNLEEVKKIVELINKMIVGTPINEVSSKLEFEIKPIISNYIMNYETIYNAFYNAFNNFKSDNEVFVKGKNKIYELPEFNEVDKIKKIVNKLDEETLSKIEEDSEGINIYIGKENELDEDLTIVKTKVRIDGQEKTLAIVGPKRMEYERVVSLLDYIKKNLGG